MGGILMKNRPVLDMTQGRPLPLLLRFGLPLVLGSLFQQLYSFADTAIVGRCISVDALSAVGGTGALDFLILGFTMGSTTGFCIPISQSVGAGRREDVSRYFWNGLYLGLLISLGVTAGVTPFVRTLLVMMNTPPQLLDMAVEYLTIILLGQTATVLYNYFAGALRALGDSRRPFYFLAASCFLNVGLDFLFIRAFRMGVAGAAAATVASKAVSAALCAWWLFARMDAVRRRDGAGGALARPSGRHLAGACLMGVPLGLEYSVTSVGSVVLQGSINTLGAVAAAAQICGERIRSIATMPMESIGMAMATYTGQNFGAGRPDRIRAGVRSGLLIQAVYSAAAWAVLFALKGPLVYLLLGESASPEALGAMQYLSIITALFIFHGSLMIFRNTVQGMGYGVSALASGGMEVVGRVAAGLLAVRFGSFTLVCLASPLAWVLSLGCCMILYFHYIRKIQGRLG